MESGILEYSYEYFKSMVRDMAEKNYRQTGPYKTDSLRYHILGFFIDYSGYNGFPEPVEDDDFAKLEGRKFYHGFGKMEFGENFLDSFSYHYGSGKQLDGFYLTDIRTEAYKYVQDKLMERDEKLEYADISVETQKEHTAAFKFLGAKGTTQKKLEEWAKKFSNFEEDSIDEPEVREKFKKLRKFLLSHQNEKELFVFYDAMIVSNPSVLAVYLGYDYLVDEVGYVIAFNRSKLAVKKSDFEKFTATPKGEEQTLNRGE